MNKKVFSIVLILVMALSLTSAALAQGNGVQNRSGLLGQNGGSKSYVVLLKQDPIVAYQGNISGYPATKPAKGKKVNPNSAAVRKYEKFLEKAQSDSLAKAGLSQSAEVHSYTFALNGYSAILTDAEVAAIRAQKDVVMVLEDQMRYPQTDSSPAFLGLTDPGGAYAKGYTGENVVVGIIDTGIWPEHPSFADNGSYAPLAGYAGLPCEFGNTAHNPSDAPFTCNNKLLGARQMLATYRAIIGAGPDEYDSARDDAGHGTHTASTSAGNAGVSASIYGIPRGTISGIAPRARIIAYKALGNLGGFTSDLAAAIDQAVADGVDVINYSIGGGASLNGADDIAFLFAADAGVFAATSAGNSGPGPATVGGPGSVPWITTVGASTQSRFFQGTIVLGDGSQYTGASITPGLGSTPLVDAADYGNELCISSVPFSGDVSGKIVLCKRGSNARIDKSYAVYLAGGAGMIMYNTTDDDNLFSDTHWVPSVQIDYTPGLAIKSYIASDPNPTAQIIGDQYSTWASAPSMTIFSSRGPDPVAEDIIKPDVTAPGLQILAGYSPTPDEGEVPGELFAAIAGTSMSSPHVAGVFALLKQAHPEWSPAEAKSALMTTAYQDVRDNDRVSQANPFAMGSGHINPGGKWTKGSITEPGLVYDAGFLDYLGFLCDAAPEVFANPSATCASLAGAGIPTEATDLNYPSIGVANLAGVKTVRRTVTSVAKENGWRTYTASVEAPPGYSVSVSPSSFRLKSGQSATFDVTITNNSGPVGEWRFGSLTWNDDTGHYRVYSPIAVRGALFDAPASITANGADGSASFDVFFGYSGDYTAAAHGFEAANVTMANVVQDPDQNFDPNDGYSNAHTFNLSGVAYFRVAIPPDATDPNADLDVYVYDPSNNLVASSTNGGTDEEVNIENPVDGVWTVYVHGWQTPGGNSDYSLYEWAISATPGGSLIIDSAPASATIGTIGTIDLSWAGLSNEWYLGAVSHSDSGGVIGLTLVEVDNR